MSWRYCETCGEWLDSMEYQPNESGAFICPVHEHEVIGHIETFPYEHTSLPYGIEAEAKAAAQEQGIIDG